MPDESQPVDQEGGARPKPGDSKPASGAQPDMLRQDEIEALLASVKGNPASQPASSPASVAGTSATDPRGVPQATSSRPAAAGEADVAAQDIEFLLHQAEEALASVNSPKQPDVLAGIAPFHLEEFGSAPPSSEVATIELIRDVELDLEIELGRTHMYLEDVLKLRKGAVVTLDKLAGDPVDIFVNGRLIARGEVLVLNDNFCVRVAELISGEAARAG